VIRVNGRLHFYEHLSNFKRVDKGWYTVEHHGVEYQIEGGKHAGGSRRDWFVTSIDWCEAIGCTSLVDALKMLDGM
jgi:hypothetical protein